MPSESAQQEPESRERAHPPSSPRTCLDPACPSAGSWPAELELRFERVGRRTAITRRRHRGPLLVQRAFYEADGGCQVYLLHPPGGVVGGDRLSLDVSLGAGAQTLITTPAATKIYRSEAIPARLSQRCRVSEGALLELLPQETILYDGAHATSSTQISLDLSSHYIGWDILCLGRDDQGYAQGRFTQHWQLERQGRLLWSERARFEGGDPVLQASWGLAGRPVLGTLVSSGATPAQLERLRFAAEQSQREAERDWFSVTRLGEVLICRYLGYSAEAARRWFSAAWAVVREAVSGRQAVSPRVWFT